MAQLAGASSYTPKDEGFESRSGHIPRLQVRSPVGAHVESNQLKFLFHINVSLSLSPPSSLSKINKHIYKNLKRKEKSRVDNILSNWSIIYFVSFNLQNFMGFL